MANNDAFIWQRKEIDRRIICQYRAGDFQAKIGPNPTPFGSCHIRSRPVLRQQTPITREKLRVRRLAASISILWEDQRHRKTSSRYASPEPFAAASRQ